MTLTIITINQIAQLFIGETLFETYDLNNKDQKLSFDLFIKESKMMGTTIISK